MPSSSQLSQREARWLAIAAQGLSAARPKGAAKPKSDAHVRRVMDQVGTIQLDAVNVLARTQFIVAFSRVGNYDPAAMRALTGPQGPWFEYWGHAASLLPVHMQPLFRWRMQRWRDDLVDSAVMQQRRRDWRQAHAGYLAAVLAEVTDRGPLAASQLSEPRRRAGEWWERRSDGRRALEFLFGDGVLAAWRSQNFERIYDLAERVIPQQVLDLPTPSAEDAQRTLVVVAAGCLGVATITDLADYFWMRLPATRARVAELVGQGRLLEVAVEGWREPAYVLSAARPRPPTRREATLLSPFDSLIWARARTQRLFDFHYRIEIYVPAPRRAYGYYVLPLLLGDRLVARLDLKADRKPGALLVSGAYAEPGHDTAEVAQAAKDELGRMRDWLGLEHLVIAPRGDLGTRLRAVAGTGPA